MILSRFELVVRMVNKKSGEKVIVYFTTFAALVFFLRLIMWCLSCN